MGGNGVYRSSIGVGDFVPGFCSGCLLRSVDTGCGLSQIPSHESLGEAAWPWIGGGLAPGSVWFLGFLTVLASGDRSGRGLLIRRSWVRAPPPEPLDTGWVGPYRAGPLCGQGLVRVSFFRD